MRLSLRQQSIIYYYNDDDKTLRSKNTNPCLHSAYTEKHLTDRTHMSASTTQLHSPRLSATTPVLQQKQERRHLSPLQSLPQLKIPPNNFFIQVWTAAVSSKSESWEGEKNEEEKGIGVWEAGVDSKSCPDDGCESDQAAQPSGTDD